MDKDQHKFKVGIVAGDYNSNNYKLILQACKEPSFYENSINSVLVYGNYKAMQAHKKAMNLPEFPMQNIQSIESSSPKRLNFIEAINEEQEIQIGTATDVSNRNAYLSLQKAYADVQQNLIQAVITLPVSEPHTRKIDPGFKSFQRFFNQKINPHDSMTLLVSEDLRLGSAISKEHWIEKCGQIDPEIIAQRFIVFWETLVSDFGITRPKIAIVNEPIDGKEDPHAKKVLQAVVDKLFALHYPVFGVFEAAEYFSSQQQYNFNGCFMLLKDSVAPFEYLSPEKAFHYTIGLPFVHLEPINVLDYSENPEENMIVSSLLFAANYICAKRAEYAEISANPLVFHKLETE